jgi:N-acetylglucosamine-6-phosphate deacetylase
LIVHGGQLALAGGLVPGQIVTAGATIAAVESGPAPRAESATLDTTLDATGCAVLPGLIDLHVHGALGADTMDADPAALARMARVFAHHGVTAFLPTTMTAPPAETLAAVRAVAAAGARPHPHGATILGVHLEGPFISPRFPGAQPAEAIRPPDPTEFARLCEVGPVRMMTLAPELPGAHALVRQMRAQGIVAVIGHSAATYDECEAAVTAGISQATHTYNAMTGLHHRTPGTLGSVLTNDALFAQLIADGVHVHPAAMKVLARCKGVARTVLITDGMRAVGLPAGSYTLGGQPVTVAGNECRLADGTLAGSVLTLEVGLRNFIAAAGLTLGTAWQTATQTPARALAHARHAMPLRGELSAGAAADLVLLDGAGEVVATVIEGRVVYLREAARLYNRGHHDPDGPGGL